MLSIRYGTLVLTEGDRNTGRTSGRTSMIKASKPKKRIIVHDTDSQHITAASINAVYNDEDSSKIRGTIQMIELATLKLVEAGMPVKKVNRYIKRYERKQKD